MRLLLTSLAAIGLLQAAGVYVYAALDVDGIQVLEPVPRYLWDPQVPNTSDGSDGDIDSLEANVTLSDHEQLLWWSNGGDKNHTTVVSMVTWASQDKRIIDMAKFAWELKAVNCTSEMWLQFHHAKSFYATQKEWEWVNFNTMNSFIMVGDQHKCGRDWSPQPWIVSRASYHAKNLTIRLHAEKSSWRKVSHMYVLDFGETRSDRMPSNVRRRDWFDWDVSFDRTFNLNLAAKWPRTFLNKTFGDHTSLTVTCPDCGVSGGLEFAGHIEGSLNGGIDHLVLSATPRSLQASLILEATLKGKFNFKDTEWANGEIDLWTIPLPYSFRIPEVLTFGPTAKLFAGYSLDSIEGHATVTAGMSASIPDDSIAKVDVFAKDKVDIHGWTPQFEVQPPKFESAGITAKGSIYGKLAVAVSLEIMDETGVNTDVYLKLPLKIEAEAGYDEQGFCDNSPSPWGVAVESSVGAVVGLEAWKELKGDKDILFDVIIFQDLDIIDLPELCFSFDSLTGTCPVEIHPETEDWYENEVDPSIEDEDDDDDDIDDDNDGIPLHIKARRRKRCKHAKDAKYYAMHCDPRFIPDCKPENVNKPPIHSKYPIRLNGYPRPGKLKDMQGVPIMIPKLKVCDDATQCLPNTWDVAVEGKDKYSDVSQPNSEHVYEGQWIRQYYDYLYKTYYRKPGAPDPKVGDPDTECKALGDHFKITQSSGPSADLLSKIGTHDNAADTMTIFPVIENGIKARVFRPSIENIDAKFTDKVYDAQRGTCALGRLVVVCQYMAKNETQTRLRESISGMNTALAALDAQPKPADHPVNLTSFRDAHQTWFTGMYGDGIKKLRGAIKDGATYLKNHDKYDGLPPEVKVELDKLSPQDKGKDPTDKEKEEAQAAVELLCPDPFVYPT